MKGVYEEPHGDMKKKKKKRKQTGREGGRDQATMKQQARPHLLFIILPLLISLSEGASIGVNYGRTASDLPSATHVVALLRSHSISRVKIFDADPSVLRSLSRSGIPVTVDLPNEQLFAAARSRSFCLSWLRLNVLAYQPSTVVESIAVGNEVFVDTHNTTRFLIPALENLQWALTELNLHNAIKISTPIALSALRSSYPPSAGAFRAELVEPVFKPLLQFLRKTESPLMVNVYPFFAYESNSDVIPLDYALFRDNPGVVDPGNGLRYFNLFDAQLDAVFAAASALGFDDVPVVVTETGWPSNGDENEVGATIANAAAYNGNLVRRVLTGGGTPLRPKADLTVYLFALFNENKKNGPTSERNYGLFYPSEAKVYDVPFTMEDLKHYKDVRSGPVSGGGGQSTGSDGGGGVSKSMSGETWCVASSEAGKEKLQGGLDYACGEGGADCKPIQRGAACYEPNTVEAHASYAFNSYYQKKKRAVGSCYFGGAAYIVSQPPKYGQCQFPTGY